MNKVSKWIAMGLAGSMLIGALVACDGQQDQQGETTNAQTAEDNAQPSDGAEYMGMTPSEVDSALSTCEDVRIHKEYRESSRSFYGSMEESTQVYTLTKDGDIFHLVCETDGAKTFEYIYDNEHQKVYTLAQNGGKWTVAKADAEASLDRLMDEIGLGEDVFARLMDPAQYKAYDNSFKRYPLTDDTIEALMGTDNGTISGYMQPVKKEYTYKLDKKLSGGDSAYHYTVLIDFSDRTIDLPAAE